VKALFKIVKFIWQHPLASRNRPLAFKRFLSWQITQKIRPRPLSRPFVEDSILIVEKGMAGATGNIYTGLLEFEDMGFLLHVLRPGDVFADIGANVGVYSILAAKNAGAKVVSFEPIPSTFQKLSRNVAANNVTGQVELKCYGVGEKAETLRFTEAMDAVNHVVGKGEAVDGLAVIEVPVNTIDELLNGSQPVIFKIDVEGFEWPALQGARQLLASPTLKGLIIELNGSGGRYGFADEQIHQLLLSFGFSPYAYDPFSRALRQLPTFGTVNNTIYIKDAGWVTNRVQTARKFNILGKDV
jgi:FkbM family methyltransferase